MTIAQRIAAELPYLRRHARALTGSQADGDAAVAGALSALASHGQTIDASVPLRRELFRIFHATASVGSPRAVAGLGALDREAQILLLLTAVEGFSEGDAAEITGLPLAQVRSGISEGQALLQEQLRSRVLVIEDEGIIALHIRAIMAGAGHDVVGVARTHGEALTLARRERPDLVLADISLADGSNGIEAVRDILATMEPTVVFVTAFPERLLTGEDVEPAFLVSKPFEPMMLLATVAQALMTRSAMAAEL